MSGSSISATADLAVAKTAYAPHIVAALVG
jgi:hypothetical protein